MRTFLNRDLKQRLTLQVVLLAALCFLLVYSYFLFEADQSAHAALNRIAGITARDLQLQQSKLDWMRSPHAAFPDLDNAAVALMSPGLCIGYRANHGEIVQRVCNGVQNDLTNPPVVFTALYRKLFNPGREVVHPVISRGVTMGEAVVWVDPTTLTARAWHDAGRLIGPILVTLLLLCCLVYAALARALQPTRTIRLALERITNNDLSTRLPRFDLAELSAISDVVNQLAESLEATLAQRNELTRRLIGLQDEERRHLARELHDEFGQCLTAIRALAASIRQSAATDCPSILEECDSISRTATLMTETLRGALFRLRPPDVDELGLVDSLKGLVAGWNGRSQGRTRFEIRLGGDIGRLPVSFGASLYRIAQEALTNTAKHAEATRVVLQLTRRETQSTPDGRLTGEIELTVSDNGRATDTDPLARPGLGLLGIRERVATLGGRLSFDVGQEAGRALRVVIPVAPVVESAGSAACPA